jgi:low affinity Fe/Cu permease
MKPPHPRLTFVIHQLDRFSSRAATTVGVAVCVFVFAIAAAFAGFPESWQVGFSTAAAGITLVMVFTIQHAQSREQATTQLKLDELIRALPQADDHFVHLEAGSDDELVELEQRQLEHHEAVREDDERVDMAEGIDIRRRS